MGGHEVSRKLIAWPGLTGGGDQADRAKHHLQFAGDSRVGSKLLANVVSEIAIRLIRLNDSMHVTGYLAGLTKPSAVLVPSSPNLFDSKLPGNMAAAPHRQSLCGCLAS
jgi:hypothetical protein